MERLENDYCMVAYEPNYGSDKCRCFGGRDKTDRCNEPAFYSKTVRGHKKAWQAVKQAWTDRTTMEQVMHILWDNGIRTHYWCMMD